MDEHEIAAMTIDGPVIPLEEEYAVLCSKYQDLGGDEAWAEGREPEGLRIRLVRAGVLNTTEAYPPSKPTKPWSALAALAVERMLEARGA